MGNEVLKNEIITVSKSLFGVLGQDRIVELVLNNSKEIGDDFELTLRFLRPLNPEEPWSDLVECSLEEADKIQFNFSWNEVKNG